MPVSAREEPSWQSRVPPPLYAAPSSSPSFLTALSTSGSVSIQGEASRALRSNESHYTGYPLRRVPEYRFRGRPTRLQQREKGCKRSSPSVLLQHIHFLVSCQATLISHSPGLSPLQDSCACYQLLSSRRVCVVRFRHGHDPSYQQCTTH